MSRVKEAEEKARADLAAKKRRILEKRAARIHELARNVRSISVEIADLSYDLLGDLRKVAASEGREQCPFPGHIETLPQTAWKGADKCIGDANLISDAITSLRRVLRGDSSFDADAHDMIERSTVEQTNGVAVSLGEPPVRDGA